MVAEKGSTSSHCVVIDNERIPMANLVINTNWIDRLKLANGRRRVRILLEKDILHVVAMAYKVGWAWTAGGNVANRYNYSACRTVCVAGKRRDNRIRVETAVGDAKKGASPITPIIPGVRIGSNEGVRIMEWANRYEEERIVEAFERFGNFKSLR